MTGEPRMAKATWQCPGEWSEWSEWLAAGLHARNRWRLPVLLVGILFAHGRRTVTTWLRAAGVSDDYQDYYYFLAALGGKTKSVATQLLLLVLRTLTLPDRLLLVIDDTPTKRYGPKVEGAGIHHNPTPGPSDQKYLYGHIWVTLSLALRHPRFGPLALPLLAMLYVRQKTIAQIPRLRGWKFATKLVLAARLIEWIAAILKKSGKTLWVVVDGGYVKAPFLKRAIRAGVTVVGRLRRDAALRDLPTQPRRGQRRRGRPPKYGKNRISLAKRAGLPRCEGSLGRRPAAGAEHLEQRGGLPSESLDTYVVGALVLGPFPAGTLRSEPFAVGRCPASSVPRRSSQDLAASRHATGIIDACRHPPASTKNHPTRPTPDGIGRMTRPCSQKVQERCNNTFCRNVQQESFLRDWLVCPKWRVWWSRVGPRKRVAIPEKPGSRPTERGFMVGLNASRWPRCRCRDGRN
jgi:hypothetical protein